MVAIGIVVEEVTPMRSGYKKAKCANCGYECAYCLKVGCKPSLRHLAKMAKERALAVIAENKRVSNLKACQDAGYRPYSVVGYQNGKAYKIAEINWHQLPVEFLTPAPAKFEGMVTEDGETFALYSGVEF